MDMTFEQFQELAKRHRTVPVYKQFLADLLTPISAFMRLSNGCDYAFLFESVEKGSQYSRYSFIGRNPKKIITYEGGKTLILEAGEERESPHPFLQTIRRIMAEYSACRLPGFPRFTGGLVGFMGYETITLFEDVPVHPHGHPRFPDSVFMLFEDIIAFDHLKKRAIVFSNVNTEHTDLRTAFDEANRRIDRLGEDLHTDIDYQTPVRSKRSRLESDTPKDVFLSSVQKAKDYIAAGDIFQVVLSQKFHRKTAVEPITLYRALRSINPSPYMFHIKLKDWDIIGASPELLVKVEDGEVEIRPIAGTRMRGADAEEDTRLKEDLLADEKERAEHLMLVDLGRNDVGRVCEYGSVTVKEFMEVEYYSHVMHIVSDIRGKLKDHRDTLDALFSGFPAGTLTGAPKIRAMEIIHELEPSRRNVYGGAVGYLDFCRNMNTCIAIRTMVMKEGTVYFQAGAGIVHDSDPETEYEECFNKARAAMSAIDFAENGLTNDAAESP